MPRVTPQYVSEQMPLDFAELQNMREVATFFALPPGDFVVMPHAMQHREGKFLLRILADQHADVWEVNEENLVIPNIAVEFGSSSVGGAGSNGTIANGGISGEDRTMDCVSETGS